METVVRRATQHDERHLFRLARAAPTLIPPDFSMFRHAFESILADLSSVLFVAEADGQLVGYLSGYRHITFYAAGYLGWVDELFVSAHARNLGIGRGLMRQFESWASHRDCVLVGLATSHASAFYERLGYLPSHVGMKKRP